MMRILEQVTYEETLQGQVLHSIVKRSLKGNQITALKGLTCIYKHKTPKHFSAVYRDSRCHVLQIGRFRLDVMKTFSLGGCAALKLGPIDVIETPSLEDSKT